MNEFEIWLESTDVIRARLLEYSKSAIPTDPGARQMDVSKVLELGQDAGDLLADADRYLAQEFAKAMLEARREHDQVTARAIAKGKTAGVKRLRDGINVMYQTLKDRRFSLMNLNRS